MTQDRKEFITCPHHISEDISEFIDVIRDYNPSWSGKYSVNLRATSEKSFEILYDNKDIDIIELNAHCRQEPMLEAGCGQALLSNKVLLSKMLEELSSNCPKEVSVKIRTNVENVDTLEIIELIDSYDIDYLHVDATKNEVMEADYDMIRKISNKTNIHIIGNNSIKTREDYEKMINSGANSVSVARAALEGDITHIFTK